MSQQPIRPAFQNREVYYSNGNTVLWSEFLNFLSMRESISMGNLLNVKVTCTSEGNQHEEDIYDFAYIAKSIIKLESLGALQSEFTPRFGTSSKNDIDRFHITFFGQKILEYID